MKKKHDTWPKISVVMFTYNGRDDVKRSLDSVKIQDYPKNKLEIIIIDNDSKDDSFEVAKRYSNKVWVDTTRDGPLMRANGMRRATGEYVYMVLEQDMEFRDKHFLKKMIKPLMEDRRLAGSFTREYPNAKQSWVTRFISYNPTQCDPLFEFLTPSISSTIVEERKDYFVCKYTSRDIPTTTHMMFRVDTLKRTPVWRQKRDFDHDTIIKLIEAGYQYFAYVPDAGDYHYHAKNLKELVGKRLRNLENHYFPYNKSIKFRWIDRNKKRDIFKLVLWVIYANLIFPATIRGIWRSLKFGDGVLLLEPIITVVTTDVILWKFITNKYGRKILAGFFKTLIS